MKTIQVVCACLAVLATAGRAEMGIVKGDRLNVRGQAKANAEVITQLNDGDRVTVLEKRTVPYGSRTMTWLKIALPDKASVWVKGDFIKDGVVTADKLNVRSGAGVNFSIVGLARRGDKVRVLRTVADWHEIQPLPGCHGWISSDYVELTPDLQPVPPAETIQPTLPPVGGRPATTPRQTAVVETQIIEAETAATTTSLPLAATEADPPAMPAGPPQAVTREGVVESCGGMLIKRPGTHYLKEAVNTKPQIIAYLNSATINLDQYRGRKVQVIGEETELMNWKNPVIEVQQIQPMW